VSKLAVEPLLEALEPAFVLMVQVAEDGWSASFDEACHRREIPVQHVVTLVDEHSSNVHGGGPIGALATALVAIAADSVESGLREVGHLFGSLSARVTAPPVVLHLPEPADVASELARAGDTTTPIRVRRLAASDWLLALPAALEGRPRFAEFLAMAPSGAIERTAPGSCSGGSSTDPEGATAGRAEGTRVGGELDELGAARREAELRAADLESRLHALERRYERLLRRRSVRLALGVAAAARGPVQLVRRLRSRFLRGPVRPSEPAPTTSGADDLVARLLRSSEAPPGVLVIVPLVDDAAEDLRSVVDPLAHRLRSQDRVLLVTAARPGPPVSDVVRRVADDPRFEVVNEEGGSGWLGVVRGRISGADVDVVILRSLGGPRSIRRLQHAAYAAPRIAGVIAEAAGGGGDVYLRRAALEDVGGSRDVLASRFEDLVDALRARTQQRGWRWSTDPLGGFDALAARVAVPELGEPAEAVIRAIPGAGPGEVSGPTLRSATRVLSVIHDGGGGTELTNLDLMRSLGAEYEAWVLRSRIGSLLMERASDLAVEWSHPIHPGWRITDIERADLRQLYVQVLRSWDIDVLHVRHLIGHTFDLPVVARALRIPVVLSLHDYYLACPTIHLLDEREVFCGGSCTPGPGPCRVPTTKLEGHPPLKHEWVYTWRQHVARMLRFVDAVVTTTPTVIEVFRTSFPDIDLPPIEVIEHGRDFPARIDAATPPVPGDPLRVLLLGNTNRNKGGELIADLLTGETAQRFEFHFLGPVAPEYQDLGVLHGAYRRERVLDEIARIRPHVSAILSPGAETYSHALSEAWAAGVPVVASRLGAPGDRISRQGGGWLVDTSDTAAVRRTLLDIAEGRADWSRRHAEAQAADIDSVASMAAAYRRVYERVLSEGADTPASVR
jgi:glycosyltransferase involved in cell wall biosynthesis